MDFHDIGGIVHHAGTEGRVRGPAPDRSDGDGWFVQEVRQWTPAR